MENKLSIKPKTLKKLNTKEKLITYFKMRERLEFIKQIRESEQMNRSVK